MQTSFNNNQLESKENKSSENIIRKCVHCGMCNATCPTYKILGDELDGPRGRIYLIKDMLENKSCRTNLQKAVIPNNFQRNVINFITKSKVI